MISQNCILRITGLIGLRTEINDLSVGDRLVVAGDYWRLLAAGFLGDLDAEGGAAAG